MANISYIEQEIIRKKAYMEIQANNITKHLSYIKNYESEIKKIEKCKNLKELYDYSNIYAYNGEKYIAYDIGEGSIDYIYECDSFEELKEYAKGYYTTQIERSNTEIRESNELITKIKADIHKLKMILLNTLDEIYADDEK